MYLYIYIICSYVSCIDILYVWYVYDVEEILPGTVQRHISIEKERKKLHTRARVYRVVYIERRGTYIGRDVKGTGLKRLRHIYIYIYNVLGCGIM